MVFFLVLGFILLAVTLRLGSVAIVLFGGGSLFQVVVLLFAAVLVFGVASRGASALVLVLAGSAGAVATVTMRTRVASVVWSARDMVGSGAGHDHRQSS